MGQLGRFRRQLGGKGPLKSSLPLKDSSGCMDLDIGTLEKIIERSKQKPLSEPDCQLLRSVVETLHFLTQELEKKHVSVQKLKQMLFGATTESTRKVLQELLGADSPPPSDDGKTPEKPATSPPPKRRVMAVTVPMRIPAPRPCTSSTRPSIRVIHAQTVIKARCIRPSPAGWYASGGRHR